jgi:2-amino-4-hydroxy-6-hydroxymethyldihydropteridine diphosphokinase
MARRVRAYIGLGSNVGEPAATLARAVAALRALPGARLRGVSRLYATTPVGVLDQPDFHNAVVALEVSAGQDAGPGALALLRQLKELEAGFGRTVGRRWGPRVLDLDLLLFGRARVIVERPTELAGRGIPLAASKAPAGTADAAEPTTRQPPEPKLLEVPHRDVADRLFVLAPLSDLAPRLVPPGWHETVATARARRERLDGQHAARVTGTWDDRRRRWA